MKFRRNFKEPPEGQTKETRKFAFLPTVTNTHIVWIRFYFELKVWRIDRIIAEDNKVILLKKYWDVIERRP